MTVRHLRPGFAWTQLPLPRRPTRILLTLLFGNKFHDFLRCKDIDPATTKESNGDWQYRQVFSYSAFASFSSRAKRTLDK